MNINRADILNQLASGQISADEAAQRLGGAGGLSPSGPSAGAGPRAVTLNGRWLRIRVTDLGTGKPKVNVNLPLTWVEAGMRIGAQYRPEVANFDLGALVEQIRSGAEGKLIEVEDVDDGERVEIFVD